MLAQRPVLMSFPPATEMFQFAGFASHTYEFSMGYRLRGGLPHSETPGSPIARISPGLFAACCVLHRLSVPRHPPDALILLASPAHSGKPRLQKTDTRLQKSDPASGVRCCSLRPGLHEDTSWGKTTTPSGARVLPRGHVTTLSSPFNQPRRRVAPPAYGMSSIRAHLQKADVRCQKSEILFSELCFLLSGKWR